MKENVSEFRKVVRALVEADFRLKQPLWRTTLRLVMHPDGHVPDTLTRIRVLEGVSVVGQGDKVERHHKGRSILIIYIKFLPDSELGEYENIENLAKRCKALPGVEIVKVLTLNNNKVVHEGRPIVV